MIEHIRTKRTAVLLGQIWKWCCIVFKSSALLSIWVRRVDHLSYFTPLMAQESIAAIQYSCLADICDSSVDWAFV